MIRVLRTCSATSGSTSLASSRPVGWQCHATLASQPSLRGDRCRCIVTQLDYSEDSFEKHMAVSEFSATRFNCCA